MNQHRVINAILPRNEYGISVLEERFCYLYTSDPSYQGNAVKILRDIRFSESINSNTPESEIIECASEILSDPPIKKRIDNMTSSRAGVFVYDRLNVMNEYKRVYSACMGDDVEPKEDDKGVLVKPVQDLKTAKSCLDSMSKTLGMFEDVVVLKDEATDPGTKLRNAMRLGREKREAAKLIECEVVDG
jgi:hypothetical protein